MDVTPVSFELISNDDVLGTLESYPAAPKTKLLAIRELILGLCNESDDIKTLKETFKWGEPSYISNVGSTVRLVWSEKASNSYFLYFICNTKLIDTFRELYCDTFCFVGNRAIEFNVNEAVPVEPLSHCLSMALSYHNLKDKPLLGA